MQKNVMMESLSKLRALWSALGTGSAVVYSPWLAVLMVAYSVGASVGWYLLKGTPLGHELSTIGLSKSRLVVILIWLGVVVFYAGLRLFCRCRLRTISWQSHATIIGSMIILSVFWLYGRRGSFRYWFDFYPPWGGHRGMWPYYFFVTTSIFARVILPAAIICLVYRRSLSDFGYRIRGMWRGWWIYAVLTAAVALIVIFYASTLPAFLRKYPWCKQGIIEGAIHLDLLLIYFSASFLFYFSGEAFWRGFILFGTTRELGKNGLFFMVMPYVLGHLGKPLPETLGAVLAGLVLGVLAWHHRSFYLGAITHFAIATTMDLAALWRRGVALVW